MNKHSKEERDPKRLRRERERESHRAAILQAAESVFSRRGFHGATVEEMAREAGYAVGTLYNFFKNKEDLYAQVIQSHHESLTLRFDALLAKGGKTPDVLAALLDLLLAHFTEHQAFVRIFFQSTEGASFQSLPPGVQRFHTHYTDSLRELFRKGVQEGEIVPLDPQLLTFCYEGFITAMIRYWAMGDFKVPLAELSRKARDTFRTLLEKRGT